MDSLTTILPLVLLAVVFYFLIIRPQRNRQKQQQAMQASLAPGTKVLTTSGVFGTVKTVSPDELGLEISRGVVITVVPAAIARVVSTPDPEPTAVPATPEPTAAPVKKVAAAPKAAPAKKAAPAEKAAPAKRTTRSRKAE